MNTTLRGALLAPVLAFGLTWVGQAQETAQPAAAAAAGATRTEKDLLGEKKIPANAYYGVQTARALENFQISGVPINHYPGFVEAWAIVKLAAARANVLDTPSACAVRHEQAATPTMHEVVRTHFRTTGSCR